MKKLVTILVVIFVVFIGILVAGPFFVINEGEQAVVVQLGRITNVVTDAGLHFRVPFIDEVVRYPRKVMAWDGEARIIPTAERQFIFVDVVARWRISDPRVFYMSVGTVQAAHSKLAEIIDSSVRTVVAENPLIESVRNSNHILDRIHGVNEFGLGDELGLVPGDELSVEMIEIAQTRTNHATVERGRRQLAEEILIRSSVNLEEEFGIELIDVVTRQISYSPELTPSVFARMIRERNQIAMYFRSDGEGRKAEWLGRRDHEIRRILSAAYAESQEIMGTADAEAARIFADAFNQNQSFFEFWRSLESYRQTMPRFDMFLTTDLDYFRFLHSLR